MGSYNIFIANITWEEDGKNRPVLVVLSTREKVSVFPITTQYNHKSKIVRKKYFPILDWAKSGLHKPSYVDTTKPINLTPISFSNKKPIGKLTEKDHKRFLEFVINNRNEQLSREGKNL